MSVEPSPQLADTLSVAMGSRCGIVRCLGSAVAVTVCASVALGQHNPFELQPVDAGYADIDELSTSLLVPPIDLRLDTNFEQVYRDPADPTRFIRIAGGITAVFPSSVYVSSPWGTLPLIPANTVFCIGPLHPAPPPGPPLVSGANVSAGLRADNHVSGAREARPVAMPVARPAARLARGARPVPSVPEQAATVSAADLSAEPLRRAFLVSIAQRAMQESGEPEGSP